MNIERQRVKLFSPFSSPCLFSTWFFEEKRPHWGYRSAQLELLPLLDLRKGTLIQEHCNTSNSDSPTSESTSISRQTAYTPIRARMCESCKEVRDVRMNHGAIQSQYAPYEHVILPKGQWAFFTGKPDIVERCRARL
jgi:uncharacterized protein YlaI